MLNEAGDAAHVVSVVLAVRSVRRLANAEDPQPTHRSIVDH